MASLALINVDDFGITIAPLRAYHNHVNVISIN